MALSPTLRSALETIAAERPNFSARCRELVRQAIQERGPPAGCWDVSRQRVADRLLADVPSDWPIADVVDLFSLALSEGAEGISSWALVGWLRSEDVRKVHVALRNRIVGSMLIPQTYIQIARRFPQFKCECDVMLDQCRRVWQQLKRPLQA